MKYNFRVTYFPPSAPNQSVSSPPTVIVVQAAEFTYNDDILMLGSAENGHAVYMLAVPLMLMPTVENLGPVE